MRRENIADNQQISMVKEEEEGKKCFNSRAKLTRGRIRLHCYPPSRNDGIKHRISVSVSILKTIYMNEITFHVVIVSVYITTYKSFAIQKKRKAVRGSNY
ncbi:CLUMA_CG010883, isoform A [Clunio marinus]|uniref:CLUMA_CG010883, isoform A n=1 Tax=Clunio marinus TaxID=568069 RepID=A0A1J1IER8_9DIPT|nr:CLUMA_CG010883, isoform A [Clunio marinus]